METAASRSGRGLWEGLYRFVMRRNSIYVTFVVTGAFVGERVVDYAVHKIWEMNNVGIDRHPKTDKKDWRFQKEGKRYEDIPVLGQRPTEE